MQTMSKMQRLITKTLKSPSLHAPPPPLQTLPLEIVADILSRLPAKLLRQLRCLCKSLNSIISFDSKFAKNHLRLSTTRHKLMLISTEHNLHQFPLFVSISNSTQTHLDYFKSLGRYYGFPLKVCSCDGMLCFTINYSSVLLWNPFINKFKLLPHLKYVPKRIDIPLFSFGYDPFVDNYKVFAVFFCEKENQVSVHTLGTDSWRRIHNNFPHCSSIRGSGIFVGGTVNWLAADSAKTIWLPIGGGAANSFHYIVSLDLKNESLQTLLQPDLGTNEWILGVVRDCLSIFANTKMCFDVWIMKEYGMKESWTKLFSVPYMKDEGLYFYNKALYISEDGKLLMYSHVSGDVILKLVVYDSKNGTFKITEIENIHDSIDPQVYVESLISPCS